MGLTPKPRKPTREEELLKLLQGPPPLSDSERARLQRELDAMRLRDPSLSSSERARLEREARPYMVITAL